MSEETPDLREKTRHPGMRLGRLASPPAKREHTLKLARYMPKLEPPPPTADVGAGVTTWPMYANDRLGDCTCASVGHMLEVFTQQVDGKPKVVEDSDVINLYNLVNGGRDDGADMLAVLDVWRKLGLASDTILAYVEVDHSSPEAVKAACWYLSGLYVGVNLPLTAQAQTAVGPWDVVPGGGSNTSPGSWGGHAVNVTGYDDHGLTVVTWGALQRMSWPFWQTYVDECYAVLPQDYDRLQGKPLANGFNEDQLKADLAALGSQH